MAIPPIFTRKSKNPIGQAGRLSEKRLARSLGAKLTPASGALQGAKGDMTYNTLISDKPGCGRVVLVEAKSTSGRAILLKHAWFGKIAKEARDAGGSLPLVIVSFTTEDGRPVPDGEWVCLPRREWDVMTSGEQ